jgi:hypothetical protein
MAQVEVYLGDLPGVEKLPVWLIPFDILDGDYRISIERVQVEWLPERGILRVHYTTWTDVTWLFARDMPPAYRGLDRQLCRRAAREQSGRRAGHARPVYGDRPASKTGKSTAYPSAASMQEARPGHHRRQDGQALLRLGH